MFLKLTHDHSGPFHQSGPQLQGILYAWDKYVGGIPWPLQCVTHRNITGGSDQGAYQRSAQRSGQRGWHEDDSALSLVELPSPLGAVLTSWRVTSLMFLEQVLQTSPDFSSVEEAGLKCVLSLQKELLRLVVQLN